MVATLRSRGIQDERVLAAMAEVPREQFVEEALRVKAYSDAALPIGEQQTISQPWIVARMTELLEPDGEGRVLEIGTGAGYHAAVLSRVFAQVYTVERSLLLSRRARETVRRLGIENVHFKVFDGTYGWSEFAPYRGILITAAAPEVPPACLDQLEEGGIVVVPLAAAASAAASRKEQILTRIRRRAGAFESESHGRCRFVPLVGRFGWQEEA
jgi:protein-L-isoaspartate(D-aspartate) O-methyltransferase